MVALTLPGIGKLPIMMVWASAGGGRLLSEAATMLVDEVEHPKLVTPVMQPNHVVTHHNHAVLQDICLKTQKSSIFKSKKQHRFNPCAAYKKRKKFWVMCTWTDVN